MHKKAAFLFPGQGAQYPGMGKDFYQNFSAARLLFEEADDLLNHSFSRLIFEGSEKELTETKNSQLAIFLVGVALFRVFFEHFGLTPSFTAGLSLGEYTALHIGGYLSFEQTLAVVQKRGLFMNEACEASSGTMAVILGLEGLVVEEMVKKAALPNDLWIANYNCPGQVVISGTAKGIVKGSELAKEAGAKRVLPLHVHGAFHSGLMEPARKKLAPFLQELKVAEGVSSVAMNVPGKIVSDRESICDYLIDQVTHSVRWEQGVMAIDAAGVDFFIEFGPGRTLSGMNKKMEIKAPTFSIEKIEDLRTFSTTIKDS